MNRVDYPKKKIACFSWLAIAFILAASGACSINSQIVPTDKPTQFVSFLQPTASPMVVSSFSHTPVATGMPFQTPTFEPTSVFTSTIQTPTRTEIFIPGMAGQKVAAAYKVHNENGDWLFLVNQNGLLIEKIDLWPTSWGPDKCHFIDQISEYSNVSFGLFDLKGSLEKEIVVSSTELRPGQKKRDYVFSPAMDWLAYIVWSGEIYYDTAQFFDVEIIKTGDPDHSKPIKLTHNGGGPYMGAAWSPDGKYLAYTDFDDSGIQQLYILEPGNGRSQRLTTFTKNLAPSQFVNEIAWAPDGKRIAFSIQSLNERIVDAGWLFVIGVNDNTMVRGDIDPKIGIPSSFWWGKDSQTILSFLYPEPETLIWIDSLTGKITFTLKETEVPHTKGFGGPITPFGDISVLGISTGDGKFYLYNQPENSWRLADSPDLLAGWLVDGIIIPPLGLVDVKMCNQSQ